MKLLNDPMPRRSGLLSLMLAASILPLRGYVRMTVRKLPESSTMRTRARRYYQSLLDSGEVKTRAKLARLLNAEY